LEAAVISGRPEIGTYPLSVTHDSSYKIELKNEYNIKRATFVRYSSTTHSTNTDQRFFELEILAIDKLNVYVRFPPATVGVPGPYHLFLLDENGIPSVAAMVMMARGVKFETVLPKSNSSKSVSGLPLYVVLIIVFASIAVFALITYIILRYRRYQPVVQ
jgi:hypothetical protein